MELYIEAALWVAVISGGFALLGLAAEGAEWFAAWFDQAMADGLDWVDSAMDAIEHE